jgi:LPXTG-motif cell wall-anchored protein
MHFGRGAIATAVFALALTAPVALATPATAPAPDPEPVEVGPELTPPAVEEPAPVTPPAEQEPGPVPDPQPAPPPAPEVTPSADPVAQETDDASAADEASVEDEPLATTAASGDVDIVDFLYEPKKITVTVGDSVTWTNLDEAPHDAKADDGSFQTDVLDQDQSEAVTFDEEGKFTYFCSLHPPDASAEYEDFVGTVKVVADDTGTGGTEADEEDDTEPAPITETDIFDTGTTSSVITDTEELPETGIDALALFAIGAALIASGLLARALVEHLSWR